MLQNKQELDASKYNMYNIQMCANYRTKQQLLTNLEALQEQKKAYDASNNKQIHSQKLHDDDYLLTLLNSNIETCSRLVWQKRKRTQKWQTTTLRTTIRRTTTVNIQTNTVTLLTLCMPTKNWT